jgi:hypothetical protein
MKNLVVAYSGADKESAQIVIGKLQKLGYHVTPQTASRRPGARSRAKTSTAPVVLLWSRNFAKSAAPASAVATLRLDAATPPARLKAPSMDLRQWRGREDHRGWRKFLTTLGGGKAVAAPMKPAKKAAAASYSSAAAVADVDEPKKSSPVGAILFLLLLAIAGGGAAYWYFMMR